LRVPCPETLQSVARVAGRVAKGHNRSRSARRLRTQAWHVRGSCARGRVAAVTAAGNLLPARTTTAFFGPAPSTQAAGDAPDLSPGSTGPEPALATATRSL